MFLRTTSVLLFLMSLNLLPIYGADADLTQETEEILRSADYPKPNQQLQWIQQQLQQVNQTQQIIISHLQLISTEQLSQILQRVLHQESADIQKSQLALQTQINQNSLQLSTLAKAAQSFQIQFSKHQEELQTKLLQLQQLNQINDSITTLRDLPSCSEQISQQLAHLTELLQEQVKKEEAVLQSMDVLEAEICDNLKATECCLAYLQAGNCQPQAAIDPDTLASLQDVPANTK